MCSIGFYGANCEKIVDICDSYCFNNGTCFRDAMLNIGCDCTCDYAGNRCENKVDFCAQSLCLNGGKCKPTGKCDPTYTCECECGFTGRFCQTPINACKAFAKNQINSLTNRTSKVENDKSNIVSLDFYLEIDADSHIKNEAPCLNGGVCIDHHCNFSCECPVGYSGARCEIELAKTCQMNTCLNGGSCYDLVGENDYRCVCTCDYFTGKNCEIYENICFSRGGECLNGGMCEPDGCNFKCKCDEFHSGPRCELKIDPCSLDICKNNGTCVSIPDTNSATCICPYPYTGPKCTIFINETAKYGFEWSVSPCSSSPCDKYHVCSEISSTEYRCMCPPFKTGKLCEQNELNCLKNPCKNGAQCIENVLDGGYICICPVGITGMKCETVIDVCASNPCIQNAGTCIQTRVNQFECSCKPGRTGTLCEIKLDPCASYPCINQGRCRVISDVMTNNTGWMCDCENTCFEGTRCEKLQSTCKKSSQNCNGNGFCIDTEPCKFKCVCKSGIK